MKVREHTDRVSGPRLAPDAVLTKLAQEAGGVVPVEALVVLVVVATGGAVGQLPGQKIGSTWWWSQHNYKETAGTQID